MVASTLKCTKCNNRTIIWRPVDHKRKKWHLKKLYCYKCKMKINHLELGEYGDKYG